MELKDLVGEHILDYAPVKAHHPFDANSDGWCFSLDNTLYFIFENPDDGYRSTESPLLHSKAHPYKFYGVFAEPIGRKVTGHMEAGWGDVLALVDFESGKTLLRVGTDYSDEDYPWFVFQWNPVAIIS